MKKTTVKLLSLLMAMLFVLFSMTACLKEDVSTSGTENAVQEPIVGREGMMPSEIRELLPQVEWVCFRFEYWGWSQDYFEFYQKDGDKIYREREQRSNLSYKGMRYNQYIDCKTGTVYDSKVNTKDWFTHQGSMTPWMDVLNSFIFQDEQINPAFDTASYGTQNKDGSYDGKLRCFHPSVKSVKFTSEGTKYTFEFEMEDTSKSVDGKHPEVSAKITIWFTEQQVTLPTNAKPDPVYED